MGGDLGELGDGPPKIEVGTAHAPPPNILRSSVVGCARKYEQSKKTCHQGIIFRNRGFPREEWVIYTCMTFRTVGLKIVKIIKTWSISKKRSSEILGVKMEIFS